MFDEVHLLESVSGANAALLLQRLLSASRHSDAVMVTGASATIADPERHLEKVFRRPYDGVIISKPSDDETELTGLVHHVFHRSMDGQNFQANLANLSSLVVHVRRRLDGPEPPNESHHKTIGFADSLQVLGAWNFLFKDLEGLEFKESVLKRLRRNNGVMGGGNDIAPTTTPLPFRFNKPLVNMARVAARLQDPVQCEVESAEAHCASCLRNEASELPVPLDVGFDTVVLDTWSGRRGEVINRLRRRGTSP